MAHSIIASQSEAKGSDPDQGRERLWSRIECFQGVASRSRPLIVVRLPSAFGAAESKCCFKIRGKVGGVKDREWTGFLFRGLLLLPQTGARIRSVRSESPRSIAELLALGVDVRLCVRP